MSGAWRELAAELADDGDRVGLLAVAVTDRILATLPLGADEEIAEATRHSVADNIWLFTSMVAAGIPPERAAPRTMAEEFVRLLARRGIGADTVSASYRLALNGFWEAWTELLRDRADPRDLADELDRSIRYMLAWVDVLSERVVEIHEQERREWVRSGEAVRADTIRDLLDGAPVDLPLAESRLGYPLARTHRCAVAWGATDPSRLAAALGTALGGARSVSYVVDRETVAVWAIEGEGASGGAGAARGGAGAAGAGAARGGGDPLEAVAADGVSVAAGGAHGGLDGFRWAYREAMHARRVALLEGRPAGAVVRYEQVALQALATADSEHARRFVAWQLGPLAGDDDSSRALAETLRSYLLHESNLRAAAAHLGVHHNTVANRLRRASELLGGPLAERGAELLVALSLLDATRADGAAGSA